MRALDRCQSILITRNGVPVAADAGPTLDPCHGGGCTRRTRRRGTGECPALTVGSHSAAKTLAIVLARPTNGA